MVEYTLNLDLVFASLADPTRRDILRRVADEELSVGTIAERYDITLAAVSKHLKILEKAQLILKRRRGKQQFVALSPTAFQEATDYLKQYELQLSSRLDALELYLNKEK